SVESLTSVTDHTRKSNPMIGVFGTFTGAVIDNPEDNPHDLRDRFRLQSAEFAISGKIDDYSSAFFNIGFHEGHAELEEGYMTLNKLPGGVKAKFGKFKTSFGKINRYHLHDLPQTDYPNVINAFFGHEGFTEEGVGITYDLPTPWKSKIEFEVVNGENENIFNLQALEPTPIVRLSSIISTTENSTLEAGVSGAFGVDNPRGTHFAYLEGVDLTYQWRPEDRPDRSFTWQTEAMLAQREQENGAFHNSFGMYSFMEYQLSKRWHSGIRVDYTDIIDTYGSEWAVSPYFRFSQSDFANWKLQFKHTQRDYERDSNAVFLQWTGQIGACEHNHDHGHEDRDEHEDEHKHEHQNEHKH
ncbi:MAG: outer membrane beta-barrel protein, partial [Vampirovibrionia bacterium]